MQMENPSPLLERLRAGDPVPRAEFLEIYSPFLSRILLSAGYSVAETETLLEIFARNVFGESECFVYSPERGTLPVFLHQILLRTLAELPPRTEISEELWRGEWRKHVLDQALLKLRMEEKPNEYAAFENHVLDGKSARETAVMCSMLPEMVYFVKTRLMRRLRAVMKDYSD